MSETTTDNAPLPVQLVSHEVVAIAPDRASRECTRYKQCPVHLHARGRWLEVDEQM